MRRLRSDTLKAAGEVVGINKNSTVSNIIDRAKYETTRDKGIRLCVENTNQKPEQRSSVDLAPFLELLLSMYVAKLSWFIHFNVKTKGSDLHIDKIE